MFVTVERETCVCVLKRWSALMFIAARRECVCLLRKSVPMFVSGERERERDVQERERERERDERERERRSKRS